MRYEARMRGAAMAVHTHRDLIAWQEAMHLVEFAYRDTTTFPSEETFGLRTQIRRAAVSVPSNIAEGAARNSSREVIQFLSFARGSLAELETQLELAVRLGFLRNVADCIRQVDRVGKLVTVLQKSLKGKGV